jgi:hypothetical protein
MKITKSKLNQIIKEELKSVIDEAGRGFFGKMLGRPNKDFARRLQDFENGIDAAKNIITKTQDVDAAYATLQKVAKNHMESADAGGGINKAQTVQSRELWDEFNAFEKRLFGRMDQKKAEEASALALRRQKRIEQDRAELYRQQADELEGAHLGDPRKSYAKGKFDPGDSGYHHGLKGDVTDIGRLEEKLN